MRRIETYFLLLVVLNLCITAAYVCGMSSTGGKSPESAPAEESARRLCFWHR